MNTRSLRFQVLVWYTILLSVGFALISLFLLFGVEQLLLQNLKELLARRVRQIAHITAGAEEPLTANFLKRQIDALYAPETPESNGRFVRVSRENGSTIFQSGMPSDGSFDPREIPFLGYKDEGLQTHRARGNKVIVHSDRTETRVGPVIVEVGAATAPIEASVRQILMTLLVAAPCLLGIAAVGAYFLVGRALKPMIQLTESAEAIGLRKPRERLLVVETGDELQTLSLALNRMIARIEEAVEANRRFVDDASHELRTPLAVLRGELETVLNLKNVSGPARETLASNLEEVERLSKIVQRLLTLSRFDSGEVQAESVVFDLARLTASAAEQMAVLAEDKGVSFKFETGDEVSVYGDPARIKQVLVNVMDNAINYTPEGGRVRVKTFLEDRRPVLEVSDSGIGIPPESLPHIFERFYRVDKARSREVGGAGLGLSIVQAICNAHQAEINVESKVGVGTTVRVTFPTPGESAIVLPPAPGVTSNPSTKEISS